MLTAQRIKHSADSIERTETSSHGKADALRLDRTELRQKNYPPVIERPESVRHETLERPTHLAQWKRWALFVLLPIAVIVGAYLYVTGGQIMWTDDAYVEADKVGVSTDVSGIVQDVDVTENQHVKAGQILYQLDARQFQIAVDNARANLAQTALTIESMKRDYRRMLSDIDTQQAQVELDQLTYDRQADLVQRNVTPKANYDQARLTLQADKSKVVSLKQQAEVQLAKLGRSANSTTPLSGLRSPASSRTCRRSHRVSIFRPPPPPFTSSPRITSGSMPTRKKPN